MVLTLCALPLVLLIGSSRAKNGAGGPPKPTRWIKRVPASARR